MSPGGARAVVMPPNYGGTGPPPDFRPDQVEGASMGEGAEFQDIAEKGYEGLVLTRH